jgi:hypothetical protein
VLVPDIRSSRSGKISTLAHPAIGVFYPRRLDIPQFNNVPIGRELGYDVELPQFGSIVVKAGTDPALVSSPMNWVKSPKPGNSRSISGHYADPNSYVPIDKARVFMDAWHKEAKNALRHTLLPVLDQFAVGGGLVSRRASSIARSSIAP